MTTPRVLVACVGNTLRGDDGFGIAVAAELDGSLPQEADLLETGIGGIGIVHSLMDGYDALIVVDAVERGGRPGEVFVLVPQVPDIGTPTFEEWLAQLSDMHLAEPTRILRIARAAGVLPRHVLVVGCQPETCEDFAQVLSASVAASVPVAAERVRELVAEIITPCSSARAPAPQGTSPAERNVDMDESDLTEADRRHLHRCIELAQEALEAGDEPFGSVLVAEDGTALQQDRNRVAAGDRTRHPEFALARWAAEHLTPDERARTTVFTSGEHCPMCSAAHGWVGLGRIVYVHSSEQLVGWLTELGVDPPPVATLPISRVAPHVPVIGPIAGLDQQVRELHRRHHAPS